MGIHDNIKKLRLERNQTLEEVGKSIGTSKQTIQRYENGEITNIPYDKIELLAKHFNVSPAFLMDWEETFTVEMAKTDVALSNMNKRMKEYALKLANLSQENQELIMQMIDKLQDKKGE